MKKYFISIIIFPLHKLILKEEDLIKPLKLGEKRAFQALFDIYFNPLSGFAYKYVEDRFIVEDMVQEVFVSLWGSRDQFDHPAALKSFLYTSVRNKCLNHLKHEKVKQKHEDSLVYHLESDQHFSARVIEEEVYDKLHSEIRNLPTAAQEIMVLALNGMKNQEIADELGVSINTVKTQKKIAYAKLKDKIGPLVSAVLLLLMH